MPEDVITVEESGAAGRQRRRFGATRRTVAAIAGASLFLLLIPRTAAELAMMEEYGNDAQMGIWQMFLIVKIVLWLLGGALAVSLLVGLWTRRRGWIAGLVAFGLWAIAICHASWSYNEARHALADANNPATPSSRLIELVDFSGIQAGYRLDNRLASNPSTPPEALRRLALRRNIGTQMCLAKNPNTPQDVLEQLPELAKNPGTPEQFLEYFQKEQAEKLRKQHK